MGTENNGYLDVDQTIINYGVREQRITFAQIIEQDPSYMLRKWLKLRRGAHSTAIGTAIAGAAGVIAGTFTGALPLMGTGLLVSAISGFLIKHHSEGVKAIATESEILDKSHHILNLLAALERRGANSSELVSLYDRMVRGAIAQRLDVGDPEHLKAFFEREISQSNLAASLLGEEQNLGIASTRIKQPPQIDSAPAPELVSQPVEAGALVGAIHASRGQANAAAESSYNTPPPPEDTWWNTSPPVEKPAHPVTHLIGDRPRSALIVSVSGGGKDILLSNALRAFITSHPAFKIVVMDCKDDPKETSYYADLPNVRFHRLNVAVSSDGQVAEWAERCVDEFNRLPEQALLICNEGTLIRAKSQRYVQAIDGLVSSGDSRDKYAWEAGQSAHTLALKINGDSRSRFRLLIIGLKGEEMQIDAILKAQCVADSARNMDDIKSQMGRSPVNRAWSDGQKWHPMPELENYSGYNRDTRSPITPTSPTAKKMTTEETRKALEKSFQSPEKFPEPDGNFQNGGNFSEGSGNRENQWEKDFSASEDVGKNFPEIEFPLLKAVYLAVKAEMENGKTKSEIVTGILECKGRKYKEGSAWFDALLQKFEPK